MPHNTPQVPSPQSFNPHPMSNNNPRNRNTNRNTNRNGKIRMQSHHIQRHHPNHQPQLAISKHPTRIKPIRDIHHAIHYNSPETVNGHVPRPSLSEQKWVGSLSGHTCYAALYLAMRWEVVCVYKDGMLHEGGFVLFITQRYCYIPTSVTSYLIRYSVID